MRRIQIERKGRNAAEDGATLEKALASSTLPLTLMAPDVSALTGLPLDAAEPAMVWLASRTTSELDSDAAGNLQLTVTGLKAPPQRRYAFRGAFRQVATPLKWLAAFILVFLGAPWLLHWAAATLATATVELPTMLSMLRWVLVPVFFVALLVGVFAALAVVFLHGFGLVALMMLPLAVALVVVPFFEGWQQLFWALPVAALTGYLGLMFGAWALGTVRELVGNDASGVMRFARAATGYLFGEVWQQRDPVGPLDDERAFIAWVRQRGALVDAVELAAAFRWRAEDEQRESVRLLVDYGGDVVVTNDGAIAYDFTALTGGGTAPSESADPLPHPLPLPAGPAPKLFGCGRTTGLLIAAASCLALLGLAVQPDLAVFPDAATYTALVDVPRPEVETDDERAARSARMMRVIAQGGGGWPWLLLLGAPVVRLPRWWWRRREYAASQRRATFLDAVLADRQRIPVALATTREVAEYGGDVTDDGRFYTFGPGPSLAPSADDAAS